MASPRDRVTRYRGEPLDPDRFRRLRILRAEAPCQESVVTALEAVVGRGGVYQATDHTSKFWLFWVRVCAFPGCASLPHMVTGRCSLHALGAP